MRVGNKDVYIIGGGPSLRGFDFQTLKNKDTIAVNVAAYDVPNPTYCITADSGIFRKLQEKKFDGIKTTWVFVTNPNHCSMKWKNGVFKNVHTDYVYNLFAANMVIRNAGTEGLGFSFDDFRTGYNSGFCAFQLAVILRYKRIHLLGMDLTDGTHYHTRYSGRIKITELDKFYRNFILALEIIRTQTEIEVISHSKISRLNKVIPYESM